MSRNIPEFLRSLATEIETGEQPDVCVSHKLTQTSRDVHISGLTPSTDVEAAVQRACSSDSDSDSEFDQRLLVHNLSQMMWRVGPKGEQQWFDLNKPDGGWRNNGVLSAEDIKSSADRLFYMQPPAHLIPKENIIWGQYRTGHDGDPTLMRHYIIVNGYVKCRPGDDPGGRWLPSQSASTLEELENTSGFATYTLIPEGLISNV